MVDKVALKIKAGNGGNGVAHFFHRRGMRNGKPDGGDGGNGGNVYLIADAHLVTLYDFRAKRIFKADSGKNGAGQEKKGRSGEDLYLKVPVGTVVSKIKSLGLDNNLDLVDPDQKILVAKGGKGGMGNSRFKSGANVSPRQVTLGTPGETAKIELELKIIADVGLIGLPSAGKTSLLNVLTNAHGKVADYHFTTLEPNLGVMEEDGCKVVLADIPGLIEGASKGKGLGHDFLRHIERTKVIVHVVDVSEVRNWKLDKNLNLPGGIWENYQIIRKELKFWSPELLKKPEIVVFNKVDLLSIKYFKQTRISPILISTKTGVGLKELKKAITDILKKNSKRTIPDKDSSSNARAKTYTIEDLPNRRIVFI